ncbi:hypothetical protein BDR05DRAFT_1063645 [Suillus weaverae]|nr:hypothetical protein BDR05DRAFT_1063645 [Suillus weaverae]
MLRQICEEDYINEEVSGSDSDGEGWIVSLLEHDITDLGAIPDFEDDRERHGPIVNDNLDHSDGGKKRKAAGDTQTTARRLVPEILGACPTKVIRAFYRKTWRYMDAYRKGLDAKQAEYAVKKYHSHRKVGAGILAEMDTLNYAE